MSLHLTTDAELAEHFGLTLERFSELRRRKNWPHVRLTRFDIRFTDEQVAQIVAQMTRQPAAKAAAAAPEPALAGQTKRSKSRSG
jgi:uncharacterized protein YecA (UPF0149 family)